MVAHAPGAQGDHEDDMESLPGPTPRTGQRRVVGVASTREEEIVQESPADAPGSGRRRRVVRVSEVAGGAGAVLQRVMGQDKGMSQGRGGMASGGEQRREEDEEDEITAEMDVDLGETSSPLVRKVAQRARAREGGDTPREEEEEDEITAEMDVSPSLRLRSSPLVRKVAQRRTVGKSTETADKTAGKRGQKSLPRRTARQSGGESGAFGLGDEVDELSPAHAPVPSSSAVGRRTVRLSVASADDDGDELSPAVARTTRRGVKRPARVLADDGGADELSPAPAKTAEPRGRPSVRKAVEGVEPPLPSTAMDAKRNAGRPPRTAPKTTETQSPASAKEAKWSVGRTRKSIPDNTDAPSPARAPVTKPNAQPLADTETDELERPSPVLAKTGRRSARVSDVGAELGEADELSPEKTGEVMGPPPKRKQQKELMKAGIAQPDNSYTQASAGRPRKTPRKTTPENRSAQKPRSKPAGVEPAGERQEPEEPEQAEEITATEAARRLGRKRPRRSVLPPAEPEEHEQEEEEEPSSKRRRERPPQSPATQQPPKTRKEKKAAAAAAREPRSKRPPTKKKSKTAAAGDDDDEPQELTGTVPITVQRFSKAPAAHPNPDSEPSDPIPFASRAGVNAVDVLAQICEELVASFLTSLREQGRNNAADDDAAARRREVKTMMRALELFGEELRTRLLEHAIALDALHALRKRVRRAQRERVALREEIGRIRREREGVEVRKDAVRVRHEREREEAMVSFFFLTPY